MREAGESEHDIAVYEAEQAVEEAKMGTAEVKRSLQQCVAAARYDKDARAAVPLAFAEYLDMDESVLKVLRKSEEELDEKIDDELAAQAEREKRIDEETQKRLAEIEEKFREKNEELEQDKKEEVKRIVRETEGDPSELARQLSELTGLSVGSNDVE